MTIPSEWLYLRQTHGDKIIKVEESASNSKIVEGDAWINSVKNTICAINTADCQAVLLFDPIKKVAAAVHNGWRGSVQNIVGKTVAKMIRDLGSKPENILAGISPSLGPCCAYFTNPFEELPQTLHTYILPDEHSVDFLAYTEHELVMAGLKASNIETAKLCTKCNSDLFFSYRADHNNPGRMAALISLL